MYVGLRHPIICFLFTVIPISSCVSLIAVSMKDLSEEQNFPPGNDIPGDFLKKDYAWLVKLMESYVENE